MKGLLKGLTGFIGNGVSLGNFKQIKGIIKSVSGVESMETGQVE